MSNPDAEIVGRCLSGDEEAYRILVQRYERPIYSLIHRLVPSSEDVRDLTQETFVKIFRSLDQFDMSRSFSSWVFKIASNQTIDFLRRRRLKTVSMEPNEQTERRPLQIEDDRPRPDENLATTSRREHLESLMRQLAPHYRLVVELRYGQERSYDEIAEILDLPLGTVKARLHRAHHQLRAWLDGAELPDEEALR